MQSFVYTASLWLGISGQAQDKPLESKKYLRAVALDLITRPLTPEEYALIRAWRDGGLE